MDVTLALLAGLALGLAVEYAQTRLGWWVGVLGGAIAFVAALIAYRSLDVGWIVVFVFGGAYLFTDVARSFFVRDKASHRGLVSH